MILSNSFNKVKEKIEKLVDRDVDWPSAIILMFSVSFIRMLGETYSSPGYQGNFFTGYSMFLHAPLLFIAIFLSLMILMIYFTDFGFNKSVNFVVLFSAIIMTPPITDLIVTGGKGMGIAYVFFSSFREALFDFFTFFGKIVDPGINYGIRLEVGLILVGFAYLVYLKSRSIIKTIFGVFVCYFVIFVYLSFPAIFALIFGSSDSFANYQALGMRFPVWGVLHDLFSGSLLNSIHTLKELPQDKIMLLDQQLDIFGTRIGWLLLVIQSGWLFYLGNKKVFAAWKENLRWERIVYYVLLGVFGILLGYKNLPNGYAVSAVDVLGLLIFLILIALSFWLAVGVNDIHDIKIDSISNADRPIVKESITIKQQELINLILFLLIITGLSLINYLVLILFLMFQSVYYVYSVPPMRLKRIFGISSLLVAINALLIMMAGFFFIAPVQKISSFPTDILLFMLVGFTIVVNIKDIKDYEGDKTDGIKTIPVFFGVEKAKKIITFSSIIFIFAFAFYNQSSALLVLSIFVSAFFYFLMTKKNYQEKYIFYLFFLYMIGVMIIL